MIAITRIFSHGTRTTRVSYTNLSPYLSRRLSPDLFCHNYTPLLSRIPTRCCFLPRLLRFTRAYRVLLAHSSDFFSVLCA